MWERRAAALAFVLAIGLAAVVVFAQPLRSPWWTYADADASYTGAALNLVAGYPAEFVDHPGLPLTETAALAFGADALLRGNLSRADREAYVDARLLDLDRTRAVFRGLAALLYLLGAALAFLLLARLLGHWTWGLAGSLLWLATPGLPADGDPAAPRRRARRLLPRLRVPRRSCGRDARRAPVCRARRSSPAWH